MVQQAVAAQAASGLSETDAEEILDRARALIPYLRSKAVDISNARRIPQEVMDKIVDAGLMQLLRPKRFGGRDAPMDLMYRVSRELSRGDGSTGWVYAVINCHDQFVGLYPEEVQSAYWASERPLSASSYMPTGKAVAVDGGYKISGKWSFCSGIDFCDWIVVGAVVGMLPGDKPMPDMRYVLLNTKDVQIIDDWHVMGLRGTGSKSIAVDDLFVPNAYVLTGQEVGEGKTPGAALHENPSYSAPVWTLFGFCIAATATGVVQTAYEVLRAEFEKRLGRQEPVFMNKVSAVQMHIAEASVLIDCSDMLYNRALDDTFEQVYTTGTVTRELRIRNRRDLAYSVLSARKAAEILMGMAGGRAITEDGEVQRALRDVFAVNAHPGMNWDAPALSYGSVALGGPPTEPYF